MSKYRVLFSSLLLLVAIIDTILSLNYISDSSVKERRAPVFLTQDQSRIILELK